ncbi:unannotated protein [freshwater metagenome]|uniref:Unannotated protein n=1 Tax=freshwater metagenome TaxID=449393 RepID=A0A6J6Y4D9_9ZZZZ
MLPVSKPWPVNGIDADADWVAPFSSANDALTLSEPLRGPSPPGVKVIAPVHDWPGWISAQPAVPAKSVDPTKVPAAFTAETLPMLRTATLCSGEVLPAARVPKSIIVG